jgi:transposase
LQKGYAVLGALFQLLAVAAAVMGAISRPVAANERERAFVRVAKQFEEKAYLGLTEKRYQSAGTDIRMGISKQGDAMARHDLYEAANVLLTMVK